ncbi:MAG: hypothetical protein AAGH48_05465 [Pseudomonadota bacterium]
MSFFPVAFSSDNRTTKKLTPIKLQNWYVQPIKDDAAKRSRAVLLPTPGLTPLVDMGAAVRGLYAEPGVRGGLLHAIAGDTLYSVSSSWATTSIGSVVSSTGEVQMTGLRDRLFALVNGNVFRWDGTTLSQVTDPDLPSSVTSVEVFVQRLFVTQADDTISWSATLDGTSWEALGFATAEQAPDAAMRLFRVGSQLIVAGEKSFEFWRATGDNALPAANVTASAIEESQGLIGPNAICKLGDKTMFVGGNRSCYAAQGIGLTMLPANPELEDQLQAMSEADQAKTTCWAYRDGAHEFFVVRPFGQPAQVLDLSTQLSASRKSFGATDWKVRFHAKVYGQDVVALEGSNWLFRLDPDVYTDDGKSVERIATVRVGFENFETIGSLALDARAYARPASGQGSNPQFMVDISSDGISDRDHKRGEMVMGLGSDGEYRKPVCWGLGGPFSPAEGVTLGIRMTDPAGVALYGAWFNEGDPNWST